MSNKPTYEELENRIKQLEDELTQVRENNLHDIHLKSVFEQAHKESEEKFKQLIKNSFDTFVLIDATGIQRYVSESTVKVTGYTPEEVTNIAVMEQLIHPEDQAHVLATFQEVITTGFGRTQYRHKHKNGGWVYLEAICSNQLDNPLINAIIVNVRDVTERQKSEQALKESEMRLTELNATKDKLFSIIAHDLRNPFNTILGFSHLVKKNIRKYDTEKTVKYLETIYSSAYNTLNLLDNLLSWANTQTGQIAFNPENVLLQPIIFDIIDILDASAEIKHISINFNPLNNLMVFADENMLKTIIRNLVSNAIKFANTNGCIEISVIINDFNAEITIADDGVGMDENIKASLFKFDANISKRGTLGEKGTGLGLILCKEFVEKHGGKIWVESVVGKGSQFTFTMPLSN